MWNSFHNNSSKNTKNQYFRPFINGNLERNIVFSNANFGTFNDLINGKPDKAGILEIINNQQGENVGVLSYWTK